MDTCSRNESDFVSWELSGVRRYSHYLGVPAVFPVRLRQRSNPSWVRGPVDMPPWFRQRVYRLFFALQIANHASWLNS